MKAMMTSSVPLLLSLLLACGKSPAPDTASATAQTASPTPDTASATAETAQPTPDTAPSPTADTAPSPTADTASAAPDTTVPPDASAPPTPTLAPSVTLLQPGDAPRHRVRYQLPSSADTATSTTLPLRLALDFSATSEDQPMKIPLPPLSLVIAATPKPDTLALAVQRVEVADGAPPHLTELLRALAGLSGERPFSARGLPQTTTPLFPPPATSALGPLIEGFSQALEQLIVPLPDEPVGPGARWLQRLPVTQHGVTFEQLTTWTLVARTDGALSLAYTVELRLGDSPERRLSPPKSPVDGTIESVDGRGTGTVMLALGTVTNDELPLPSPLPLRVTGDHTLSLTLEVTTAPPGDAAPPSKRLTLQSRMSLSTDDPKPE